ncbi:hypothetical protein NQ318_010268 [Aromia moschata]|uniref:Uncharacterized protein n=1 Tax=Aromia moschata TaxID=1265417 RepID=A0AAV8YJT6_9CUCU|nr:hypothetical protein NQ318_010268 [Aromia moschata]
MKLACLWITEVIHELVRCAQLKELLPLPKVCVKTQEPQLVTEHNNLIVGRMKEEGWSKELEGKQLEDELSDALSAARAWMEIIPEKVEERPSGTLQVGETTLLRVKSTLPVK